jgi:hypothetical protein
MATQNERRIAIDRIANQIRGEARLQQALRRLRTYLNRDIVRRSYPDYRNDGYNLNDITYMVFRRLLDLPLHPLPKTTQPSTSIPSTSKPKPEEICNRFEILDI